MNPRATLLVFFVIGTFIAFPARSADEPRPPKQGAALLKTDILGVFAHPDDETGVAAVLAEYALVKGKVVANVYCTRGEAGGNMVGNQWGPSLGILREAELRDSLARLEVRYCYFLDREDFFYTESAAATWRKWGKEETLERLVRLIRALRPEVIITMDPAPTPGQHGHHQAAGILATEAFTAAADPARFPEQLAKEGLSVWQVRKLYYPGGGPLADYSIDVADRLPGGKTPEQIAGEAAADHRSQGFGNFSNSPRPPRPRIFTLVKSVVGLLGLKADVFGPETDLLGGLPATDSAAHPISEPIVVGRLPLLLEFIPRPAIANYSRWLKAQNIEAIVPAPTADLPVVAGEENEIQLNISNQKPIATEGEIGFQVPAGWKVQPESSKYRVQPSATETLHCRVKPPTSLSPDADLTAATSLGDAQLRALIRLHVIPRLTVPLVRSAPALDGANHQSPTTNHSLHSLILDGGGAGWDDLPAHYISPSNLVSGHVRDAADSSATFRLAYNSQTLFVDVDVADDIVVTNIAPDDIRGHWRSDSIEICVDPAAGAESTVDCFKVGIFPFDTTGVVRAARDADARQGPIEETAPGMRVVSRRTPTGYRIQAAIPFKVIGIEPVKGKRLGFNLIIYDGDKANAALGENINKSRLAWSPRSGVPGRPEDWGRIDLE
jgi:LmbE family N-acetylglucosaminyl deacetylase